MAFFQSKKGYLEGAHRDLSIATLRECLSKSIYNIRAMVPRTTIGHETETFA
jgi:hypothetical protein